MVTDLALYLDRLVRRVHVELTRKAPEFDTDKIGPGGGMILLTLDELGECAMVDLARALVRDKSQMTRAVASLERKGLVAKTPSPSDSRVTLLQVTEKGQATVQRMQRAISEAMEAQLTHLDASQRLALQDLLRRAVAPEADTP